QSDTVNSGRLSDIDSLVASWCLFSAIGHRPASLNPSLASRGPRQKLAVVARRTEKSIAATPPQTHRSGVSCPRAALLGGTCRGPVRCSGQRKCRRRSQTPSRSKTPSVRCAPNSNAHSSAACWHLKGTCHGVPPSSILASDRGRGCGTFRFTGG